MTPKGLHFAAGLVGVWLLMGRRENILERLAVLLMGAVPYGSLLYASGLRLYPYGSVRLMLFLAPATLYVVAVATADLMRSRLRLPIACAASTMFALFIWSGVVKQPYAKQFMHYQNRSFAFDLLRQNYRAGEAIAINSWVVDEIAYYCPEAARGASQVPLTVPGLATFWLVDLEGEWSELPDSSTWRDKGFLRVLTVRTNGLRVEKYVGAAGGS